MDLPPRPPHTLKPVEKCSVKHYNIDLWSLIKEYSLLFSANLTDNWPREVNIYSQRFFGFPKNFCKDPFYRYVNINVTMVLF